METENTKAAWQSLGVTAPVIAIGAFVASQWGGYVIPADIQGQIVAVADILVPVAIGVGIWGRKRAKAVIDRWL